MISKFETIVQQICYEFVSLIGAMPWLYNILLERTIIMNRKSKYSKISIFPCEQQTNVVIKSVSNKNR